MNSTQLTHNEWLDAEAPHTPRDWPFQAWSLAELLRLDRVVLGTEAALDNLHLVALR